MNDRSRVFRAFFIFTYARSPFFFFPNHHSHETLRESKKQRQFGYDEHIFNETASWNAVSPHFRMGCAGVGSCHYSLPFRIARTRFMRPKGFTPRRVCIILAAPARATLLIWFSCITSAQIIATDLVASDPRRCNFNFTVFHFSSTPQRWIFILSGKEKWPRSRLVVFFGKTIVFSQCVAKRLWKQFSHAVCFGWIEWYFVC